MDALLMGVHENPLRYIEYLFAFFGAMGILMFLAGWGSGMPHFFTMSESDSHMEHTRTRATWGLLICMVVLGLWEIVRVIVGEAPLSYLILSLLLLTPLWVPWVKGFLGGKGGGGSH